MLHVSLHITRVIDVGGVYALGELCLLGHKIITNPFLGYFGRGSGRSLN